MNCDVSIIVPAYNEEKRASGFLEELSSYCIKNISNYEIICVDDGSTDKTKELFESIASKNSKIRIVSYEKNMGKGYAVKKGVESAKMKNILFIDADGSIAPNQISKMAPLFGKFDIILGFRYAKKSKVRQPALRKLTGFLFNSYVNMIYRIKIKDTLCGFKGFKSSVAKKLFNGLKSNRWIFDVEILYKARKSNYSICKLPIVWAHKEDTKMSVIDPIKMAFSLLKLRIKLLFCIF